MGERELLSDLFVSRYYSTHAGHVATCGVDADLGLLGGLGWKPWPHVSK